MEHAAKPIGQVRQRRAASGSPVLRRPRRFGAGLGKRTGSLTFLLGWFFILVAAQPAGIGTSDTAGRLQVARSLWTSEPEVHPSNTRGLEGRGGILRAGAGLGQSLLLLPADVISATILGRGRDLYDPLRSAFVAYLVFPLLGAVSVGLMAEVARGLGATTRESRLSACLAAIGSSFLAHTAIHQENSLLFALDAGMILCAIRLGCRPSIRVGITAGVLSAWAILTRLPALADSVVCFGLALALSARAGPSVRAELGKRRGALVAWGTAILCGLSLERLYQIYRFGEIESTYIHVWARAARAADPSLAAAFPFNVPLMKGAFDELFSPSFGIWQSEPLLLCFFLLLPAAWAVVGRVGRAVVVACILLLAGQIVFYGRFYNWFGGDGWGNRFLATPAQLLSLLAATWVVKGYLPRSRVGRGVILTTCVLSSAVGLAAMVFWYELETKQIYYLGFGFSQVLLRFANIAALLCSRLVEWGLVVPGVTPRMLTPNLAPFLVSRKVPTLGSWALAAWIIVAFAGIGLLLWSIRAVPITRALENGRDVT